ncbi:DNA-binding protein YbaB [Saccharopolyspora phatthalungensis]|uniref:DNA-binding protein YbaB n=2 Tax=Saccharopolyspora phatthalungensis TaxID=664693 RepID=A0A840Q152_9PSEU|nr:DNA-binding protein YbaB [Saccharopolyspora phatthalungensis]
METALQELQSQQKRIREAQEQVEKETTSFRTKDRMITATVDHRQRLTGLKLSGSRYRSLAPAELASRIVEAVQTAQDEAAKKSMDVFNQLAPTGVGLPIGEIFNGDFDLKQMFEEAVKTAETPLFPDNKKPSGNNEEADTNGSK